MLGYDDQSGAGCTEQELAEVRRHRATIVAHQDTVIRGCDLQDFRIGQAAKPRLCGGKKIDTRLSPEHCADDRLIEIGIRLKANRHS